MNIHTAVLDNILKVAEICIQSETQLSLLATKLKKPFMHASCHQKINDSTK